MNKTIKFFLRTTFCWSFFTVILPVFALTNTSFDETVTFDPPKNWHMGDISVLPSSIKVMVVGEAKGSLRPSLILATESFKGSLEDYLKIVKKMNKEKKIPWKDLGPISTEAGVGSLSQIDFKTQYGDLREMHFIMVRNGTAYILTAAALKPEFGMYYEDFFQAMKSFKFIHSFYDILKTSQQKQALKNAEDVLNKGWIAALEKTNQQTKNLSKEELQKQVFYSEIFQKEFWEPFQQKLVTEFNDIGGEWQNLVLAQKERDFLSSFSERQN